LRPFIISSENKSIEYLPQRAGKTGAAAANDREKAVGNKCSISFYLMITAPLFHVTKLRRSYDILHSFQRRLNVDFPLTMTVMKVTWSSALS